MLFSPHFLLKVRRITFFSDEQIPVDKAHAKGNAIRHQHLKTSELEQSIPGATRLSKAKLLDYRDEYQY